MAERVRAFIGLGANLGDRAATIRRALACLAALPATVVRRVSHLSETAPWGKPDQPWFLNAVAEIDTGLPPHDLLRALKQIETRLGRLPGERWGPRVIDLDLLLYDEITLSTPDLTIPHPSMDQRAFVLVPLQELWPDYQTADGTPIVQAIARLLPTQPVRLWGALTPPSPTDCP